MASSLKKSGRGVVTTPRWKQRCWVDKLRCWVEVVEEDGGGFICTWDGGCAYGAMEVDPIASAWKGEGEGAERGLPKVYA